MGNPRLAVLLGLGVLLGCSGDGESGTSGCTEIGCQPATAQVQLSGLPAAPAVVELCADDECRTVRGSRRQLARVVVGLPRAAGERVEIRVRIRSRGRVIADDAALIPVDSIRPNGPDCPPVCRYARSRMSLATSELEHDPTGA
jgi:hypothetical protein